MNRYWKLRPAVPDEQLALMGAVSPLMGQLLYNRGITNYGQVQSFFAIDESLLCDPFLLPDVEKAVARIRDALSLGESIAVYGDFDADGVTSTALMVQGLTSLGGKVVPYIPNRHEEGRGLSTDVLDKLYTQGVSLIITVDRGTTSYAEAEYARDIGLDLIITDHHSVINALPSALAVVNPKRNDSKYPFMQLAGVGVAFKLLQALVETMGSELQLDELLDLVAIGTVSDVMPLTGENRYLVHKGLEVINRAERVGLRELMSVVGLQPGNLDASSISWVLGPRINATGRLVHAISSYKLLMTQSESEAQSLAAELEHVNAERQRLTAEVLDDARQQLLGVTDDLPIVIVGGEGYHQGVVGLVAGKLVEEFYRPAIVMVHGPEFSHGSARSIPEFNMVSAIGECQDLFTQFGGHPMAAGFTVPSSNLPEMRERLLRIAENSLDIAHLSPTLTIECELPLSAVSTDTYEEIRRLAPFGAGNSVPTFLSCDVEVVDAGSVGVDGAHLKLRLRQDGKVWTGISFRQGHRLSDLISCIDVVYGLKADRWGNDENLELEILDFRFPF